MNQPAQPQGQAGERGLINGLWGGLVKLEHGLIAGCAVIVLGTALATGLLRPTRGARATSG